MLHEFLLSMPGRIELAARRWLGLRWFEVNKKGWEARFNHAEVTAGKGFALALCSFEDHYSLHIHLWKPNIFLQLPFLKRWHREPIDMMESWGFTLHENDSIHLNWGSKNKIVHLPWAFDWVRSSHLMKDGSWLHERPRMNAEARRRVDDLRAAEQWKMELPYRYTTRSGTVQDVTATITVEETEWRPRIAKWTRLVARTRRYIDVSFSKGVGESVDSWKGGVYGTGWEMRQGETPEETLRRMEREAVFR